MKGRRRRTVSWYAIADLEDGDPLAILSVWRDACDVAERLARSHPAPWRLVLWCWSERRTRDEDHGRQDGPPPPFCRDGRWSPYYSVLRLAKCMRTDMDPEQQARIASRVGRRTGAAYRKP